MLQAGVLRSNLGARFAVRCRPLQCIRKHVPSFSTGDKDVQMTVAERLYCKRHTAAHVLAMAIQRLVPDSQATIGPCIDNG